MSNQINDGGPAFPNVPPDSQYSSWDMGMTLRDYFAAAALQGILCNGGGGSWDRDALNAFKAADAMIQAREVKP